MLHQRRVFHWKMFRYVSYSMIIFEEKKKTFWGINKVVAQFACTVCGILRQQHPGVTESHAESQTDVLLQRLKFNRANWEIRQQAVKITKNPCKEFLYKTPQRNVLNLHRNTFVTYPTLQTAPFQDIFSSTWEGFFLYGCFCSICCIPLPDCRFSLIHYRQRAEACELYRRSNPSLVFRRCAAEQPPLQGYSNEFIISATLSLHKTGFLLVCFKRSFVICCHAQNNISVFPHKKMSKHNTKAWMQNNTSLCAAAEESSAAPLENIQFFVTQTELWHLHAGTKWKTNSYNHVTNRGWSAQRFSMHMSLRAVAILGGAAAHTSPFRTPVNLL